MSAITTHILDAVLGAPAAGINILLERRVDAGWLAASQGITDDDGRCRNLGADHAQSIYRLTFAVEAYFRQQSRTSLYPEITITFAVDGRSHYHIPLLLSDNSYTTYRGS